MKKFLQQLYEGIFTNNPVFVQLIGMCPTLATTTSLQNGIGMGLAATAVLICSNAVISLLRKLIPSKVRIAAYITIIAGLVTAVDLLIQAYLPDLSKSLGLFIPLMWSTVLSWPGQRLSPPKTACCPPLATAWPWAWALPSPCASCLPFEKFWAPAR